MPGDGTNGMPSTEQFCICPITSVSSLKIPKLPAFLSGCDAQKL
ncbi:hypothetical protein L798_12202 [Zootermopsis nevadensis]|uniref:Uncharacterized protein n=1 Tax=Zootermopsis nevadensis TaxID=136037 RepID=A0A067QVQ9_ZOONE|nr:hypothetical protein L798_12202 [Zootermopsis nevadensis]